MNDEIVVGDTSPEGLEKNIRGAGKILEALIMQNYNDCSRMAHSHLLAAIEFGVIGNRALADMSGCQGDVEFDGSGDIVCPCKPKWTSVLDSLPDNHVCVLVLDSCGYQSVCFRANRVWNYSGCHDSCCSCDNGNVTHWMELPCPPMTK